MNPMNLKFECPKCGGRFFGIILKFVPDPAFPPLETHEQCRAAHDAGRGIICGGSVIPPKNHSFTSTLPTDDEIAAMANKPRVLLEILNDRIACHSLANGEMMSGSKTRGVKPCGWIVSYSDDAPCWHPVEG